MKIIRHRLFIILAFATFPLGAMAFVVGFVWSVVRGAFICGFEWDEN